MGRRSKLFEGEMIGKVRVLTAAYRIKRVALCAGSGGSVFKGLTDVDVFFTGEFSHHEALAAVERGISVITCKLDASDKAWA